VRATHLPFSPPLLGDDEIAEVVETLRSDWITTGPKTAEFERRFAERVGAPAGLALNSCTAGLHVALAALGVGPGDAVFTSTWTFCATANVIEHVGARPILLDVEPDTLNLDPAQLEKALAQLDGLRPAAVMPVHFAGHPCEMDQILDIAAAHDLAVVEDAAHSFPAAYRGEPIGALRDQRVPRAAAFSFYATKNITTAEGGMLTGTPAFLDEARVWSLHGMSRDAWKRYGAGGSWFYEVTRPGFKYNMTDMAASLGLHQLDRVDGFVARRAEIATRYRELLAGVDAIELPAERAHVDHAWHLFVVRVRPELLTIGRNEVIDELSARKIGTSVHFIPVHQHPYYRDRYGYAPADIPVASGIFERVVSLPIYPQLTDADVDDVVGALVDIVAAHRR
jgi:dTDP-4-amino-4,6-dideoxygalactose transaminase